MVIAFATVIPLCYYYYYYYRTQLLLLFDVLFPIVSISLLHVKDKLFREFVPFPLLFYDFFFLKLNRASKAYLFLATTSNNNIK